MSPTSLADNQYQLIDFTGEKTYNGGVSISIQASGKYPGMPELRMITLEIMDVDNPSSVTLSDKTRMERFESPKAIRQYGYCYDPASRTLTVRFAWNYKPLTVTAF